MSDSIPNVIMHEIMAFEKYNGKKPAYLILCDIDFKNLFFSQCYQFVMTTDGADFKTPGYFMGVKIIHKKIYQYAGACKWMLAGDE